ncbi:MAG: penicillin-binding protein 2 [Eggerthellaceae bacterium]|nr:penicillin-binding protein 2 [Eggerthellaceae bacterium]
MVEAILVILAITLSGAAIVVLIAFLKNKKSGEVVVKSGVTAMGTQTPVRHADKNTVSTQATSGTSSGHAPYDRIRGRFVAFSVFVGGIFALLAGRLWTLQIIKGDYYRKKANDNLLITVNTPAPRGRIFDATGTELVGNVAVSVVLAEPSVSEDNDTMRRLSSLLGIPFHIVRHRIQDASQGAQAQRVVSWDPSEQNIAFIAEHPDIFPGIFIDERTNRTYHYGALACQLLGYAGTISEEELENAQKGSNFQSGDVVGKGGVEASFDGVLSGEHGKRIVATDVKGSVHEVRSETPATQGSDVYLTIVAGIQQRAEEQLKEMIAPSGVIGLGTGTAGAVVAMDVTNGDILAMANFPTFNPEDFVGGISEENWERYNKKDGHNPLMNRCIAGAYPAASTFKAFTGMAGLHYGFASKEHSWVCTGTWTGFGEKYPQKCWEEDGHGGIDFRRGVVVSCDTVFYEIAKRFDNEQDSVGETALQDFVSGFGFGKKTGIELAGEIEGIVPTPAWKKEFYADQPEEGKWQPGDMTNMSIGQGNVLITPLQLAVGYAGVATGSMPVPQILHEVRNSEGDVVVTGEHSATKVEVAHEDDYKIMRDALRGVAKEDGSLPEMLSKYDYECACKTGTGEAPNGKGEYSWFAMYAPYDKPKYVVTCIVEEGGWGVSAAAPVAMEVMDACIKHGKGALSDELNYARAVTDAVQYIPPAAGRGD